MAEQNDELSEAAWGLGDSAERDEVPRAGGAPLSILLDLELPVHISFGRTRLLLEQVLNLKSGSMIQLDRAIDDPVEMVVNNCVLARGSVVVVDGNYGVKITEIASRDRRLRAANAQLDSLRT